MKKSAGCNLTKIMSVNDKKREVFLYLLPANFYFSLVVEIGRARPGQADELAQNMGTRYEI